MCQVGVCNEGRWSSMEFGLSKGGKWVFNTACTMPWCHISKGSGLSSTVISNALRKTRTQLGPSSSLDYRAQFTLSKFYTPFRVQE